MVGGGLAGLTTALECLRNGQRVAVLESQRVGFGASGRNGGFVMPGFAESLPVLVDKIGLVHAKRLYAHSRMGVQYVREQIRQLAPRVLMGTGSVTVSRFPQRAEFENEVEFLAKECAHYVEFWDKYKTRQQLKSTRYFEALHDAEGFHIHPLNYVRALARAITERGGLIFEHSAAESISLKTLGGIGRQSKGQRKSHQNRRPAARTLAVGKYSIDAANVVVCTSAYDRKLVRKIARAILPVATHVVVTQSLDGQSNPVVTDVAIADTRRAGDYYRRIHDNRLLWGGKITTRQSPPRSLERTMQTTIGATYPELGRVGIDYCWSGLMAYAMHKMPLIGEIEPGLWVATGFGGHGLNTTAMAGCLVAGGICEGDERWKDFSVFQPQWAGGAIGRLGVQGTYWSMQFRDWIEEYRGRERS